MSRFTLSKLFSPWTAASSPPKKAGWYRTRTEKLSHSWWNGMVYFDGETWWEYARHLMMSVRREVKVLQWQGLNRPLPQVVAAIHENMPRSGRARRDYERFLESLGGAPKAAA